MHGGVELPFPDYAQLSTGILRHPIRSLDRDELEQVLEYERVHADRARAKQMLAARIKEVAAGAAPSPADHLPGRGRRGGTGSPSSRSTPIRRL